ncbi:hypothetical protein KFL_006200060 [Klebsormidium nitens]|uniref:Uncharacterized protein n=1 Tax=Klebsormidium nitens TaxID=105231 RepID=A0A1Y1INB4_KLENI|nr:hypothetical protein KFL_006200060 [Klebsormidium nitens]|eukprot:GAQ90266.1 hypothetical protein KFL_006200060 [Klebsormidium nitens]
MTAWRILIGNAIQRLEAERKSIEAVPLAKLTQETRLTRLDLSGCVGFQSLPESIAQLTGLTRLDLSGCKGLQSLPESVGALTGFTSLDPSGRCGALQSLPDAVGSLTGLTNLDLSRCKALQSLPESVGALTGVIILEMTGCEALRGASRYWWAAKGDAAAQCNLGVCFELGKGVEEDEARATELYAKAAAQGDARAQCCLGWCYENGRGVEKDEAHAADLERFHITSASENGCKCSHRACACIHRTEIIEKKGHSTHSM